MLAERTKVVTEMVEQLNAAYLSLGDASRVWHEDCRIGVGHRGGHRGAAPAPARRRDDPDQVAHPGRDRLRAAPGARVRVRGLPRHHARALMAIKSSDLTFTVTTYVVFQELRIAEQHHCWDQVGVFKRLFGGEIPPTVQNMLAIDEETAAGRKQPLEV
ncbi:hypothetical protein ON010_g11304 [Phytophthora cinnamomi]|nr:hypothetical protein ON010_g11304 [Phytophthora cinnamomi]